MLRAMMLDLRDAVADDEAAVVSLWRDCGLVVPHNDPGSDFRAALDGPASTVLLGIERGLTVGSVMVGHDGHRGWFYYLAVTPSRRGLGIGRRLVSAAEEWLGQHRVRKVQLMVRTDNRFVLPFYERLGFAHTPRVVMSKWLVADPHTPQGTPEVSDES